MHLVPREHLPDYDNSQGIYINNYDIIFKFISYFNGVNYTVIEKKDSLIQKKKS